MKRGWEGRSAATGAWILALAMTAGGQEKAAVVWWSAPVERGEWVQVHGGDWGDHPVVEVVGLDDRAPGMPRPPRAPEFAQAARVAPVKVTESGLCFEFPRAGRGRLAACRIVPATGAASEPFVLNEPDVWWVTGDRGAGASPGGTLRLFGRCLAPAGAARVVLAGSRGRVEVKLSKQDAWSLDAALPGDLAPGTYEAFVHNGAGGPEGWRRAGTVEIGAAAEAWKTDRFDAVAFGAVPNDGMDDTLALQAALAAAASHGGGTVWLPRGRLQCNGTLRIPPHTLLRGESRETAELYWPDCDTPPENLIEGGTAFGIEDLFIHAGKYRNGIVCTNAAAGQHALGGGAAADASAASDITIRRVRLKLVVDQYILKNTAEYETRAYLKGNGLVIRDARNVRVEDCDLYASKEGSTTLYFILSAEHLRIANCRINGSGWAVVGGDKVIFENNEAWNCTYSIAPVCRNLFWSNNRQHDLFTNNRESITHDGARTAFRGLAGARCGGLRVDLDLGGVRDPFRNGPAYWVGREIQLVEGRGAGQTRTIVSITNASVTIDRPWAVAPDATSRFVVASERRHLLYVDNTTEDSSIAIQLYGGLTEGVLARNRSARAGGFRGFGMDYHGIIPLWFVQFLDNEILEGNGYRGPGNEVPPRDSVMEIVNHGGTNRLTRSCVIRRGTLHNNANVLVGGANALVENCTVRNADIGISVVTNGASGIVLHGNRFENVIQPLDPGAMQGADLPPAERALAMIAGAEAVLGPSAPAAWRGVKATLDREAGTAGMDAAAATRAGGLLAEAVRALAAQAGTNSVDARGVRSLLGASVRLPDWDPGMTRFMASTDTAATVTLRAGLAPAAPAATCRISCDSAPGWSVEAGPCALVPGRVSEWKVAVAAPAGAKGFFRLPVTVEYAGDGWALRCRENLRTLTENRLTQWIAVGPFACPTNAPFDAARAVPETPMDLKAGYATAGGRAGWRILTNVNVHGAADLAAAFGTNAAPVAVVAVAALRVARPTTVRLAGRDGTRLFVDGVRLGSDTSRGNWGSASLAPGLHVVRAVVASPRKGGVWELRAACEVSDACLPGDLVVVPAAEVMAMGALSPAAGGTTR